MTDFVLKLTYSDMKQFAERLVYDLEQNRIDDPRAWQAYPLKFVGRMPVGKPVPVFVFDVEEMAETAKRVGEWEVDSKWAWSAAVDRNEN